MYIQTGMVFWFGFLFGWNVYCVSNFICFCEVFFILVLDLDFPMEKSFRLCEWIFYFFTFGFGVLFGWKKF